MSYKPIDFKPVSNKLFPQCMRAVSILKMLDIRLIGFLKHR